MQTNAITLIAINSLRRKKTKQKNNEVDAQTSCRSVNLQVDAAPWLSGLLQGMFVLSAADKTKKQRNLILHKGKDYNRIMWSKFVNSPDKE